MAGSFLGLCWRCAGLFVIHVCVKEETNDHMKPNSFVRPARCSFLFGPISLPRLDNGEESPASLSFYSSWEAAGGLLKDVVEWSLSFVSIHKIKHDTWVSKIQYTRTSKHLINNLLSILSL